MYKAELREKGFDGQHINPKTGIIVITQLALIIVMIAFGLISPYIIAGIFKIDAESDLTLFQSVHEDIMESMGQTAILVFFIIFMILYFALKILITLIFCKGKNSIALTILKRNSMPVFLCREAFSVRDTAIIYLLPAFIIYSVIFICNFFSLFTSSNMIYAVSAVLLSFFLSGDVTIVLYALYMKIKTGIDYISIDEHIYSVTLFYKTKPEAIQSEEAETVTAPADAEDDIVDRQKVNISIPTAPGQNFLKITGIFYMIAGGINIISALIVRFINLGTFADKVSLINGDIFSMAAGILPSWRFTAVNNVFAILERLHIILPEREFAPNIDYIDYTVYLRYPVGYMSTILTFAAVIIGIFIFYMGITAVKYCATLKYAKRLMIFSLINLSMMLISTIFCVSFFSVIGCIIAVLYFAGAFQNYISYEKLYAKTDSTAHIKK